MAKIRHNKQNHKNIKTVLHTAKKTRKKELLIHEAAPFYHFMTKYPNQSFQNQYKAPIL